MDELRAALVNQEKEWDEGDFEKDVILATGKDVPLFSLVHTDPFDNTLQDKAEFNFNTNKPLLKPEGYFTYEEYLHFFLTAIDAYQAKFAGVFDSDLETLISSAAYYGEVEIDVEIDAPAIVTNTPEHLIASIGKVLSPDLFNPLEIPPAIYWFNYWNEQQVRNIGEEKIRNAAFQVITKQPDGGYILIVQKDNFDTNNVAHLEKLAALYNYFDLYSLQEQSPIERYDF
jgi:hypothetical protein